MHELEGQSEPETRFPDTTRGWEVTNDLDEGIMLEGVPVYETTEGPKNHVDEVNTNL